MDDEFDSEAFLKQSDRNASGFNPEKERKKHASSERQKQATAMKKELWNLDDSFETLVLDKVDPQGSAHLTAKLRQLFDVRKLTDDQLNAVKQNLAGNTKSKFFAKKFANRADEVRKLNCCSVLFAFVLVVVYLLSPLSFSFFFVLLV